MHEETWWTEPLSDLDEHIPIEESMLGKARLCRVQGALAVVEVGYGSGYWSERIAIKLLEESKHLTENYGFINGEFVTKYFEIRTPGILHWGHDGVQWTIIAAKPKPQTDELVQ